MKRQWKTPDDGQRHCLKHVKFRTVINLEISASVGITVKKFNFKFTVIWDVTPCSLLNRCRQIFIVSHLLTLFRELNFRCPSIMKCTLRS